MAPWSLETQCGTPLVKKAVVGPDFEEVANERTICRGSICLAKLASLGALLKTLANDRIKWFGARAPQHTTSCNSLTCRRWAE
jgi:hypothetical protein